MATVPEKVPKPNKNVASSAKNQRREGAEHLHQQPQRPPERLRGMEIFRAQGGQQQRQKRRPAPCR